MFSFGNPATNSGGNTGSGSLFGNKSAGSGGFSFGQNNAGQQTQTSSGMFGQQQTNTGTTGSSLFGNKTASTGGLNSGFSFGQTTSQQPQNNASVGLFGNAQQNQNTSGGGMFGSNTLQKPGTGSGGLFGNKPAGGFGSSNTQPAASGGLFGSNNQANSSGGLFGTNQQQPTGKSLFNSQSQVSSTGNQGLFGNQGQQAPLQSNSMFGSSTVKTTQPSFGWSQQSATQQPSNEQQQQQLQQQQAQQQQLQQQQQMQNSNYPQQIQEQVIKCKESWDPQSSRSKLRTFVYNKVNETEAMLYTKPVNVSQEDWDNALLHKPSPTVIPVQVFGFEELNFRNTLQREHVAQARLILSQILEKLTKLSQKHDLDTATRILKAQTRNVQIQQRILKLGSQLAILKSKGLPLSVNEEKLWSEFEKLLQRSNDPAGLGKNNELWARLSVLKERAKTISDQLDSTLVVISENGSSKSKSTTSSKAAEKRLDDEVENRVNKIAEILSNQQRGLCYLNDILEKDNKLIGKYVSS